jgi:hypothetical protein
MNYKIYIVVILVVILLILNFGNTQSPVQKQDTKKENFETDSTTLKLYYTNWCGWSQRFLPVWDELSKKATIKMEKIDCEKNKDSCQGIPGFPYLVLEKEKNEKVTYKGDRTIDDLLQFLEKNSKK